MQLAQQATGSNNGKKAQAGKVTPEMNQAEYRVPIEQVVSGFRLSTLELAHVVERKFSHDEIVPLFRVPEIEIQALQKQRRFSGHVPKSTPLPETSSPQH